MKVRRIVRRVQGDNAVSVVNAVTAANVGEANAVNKAAANQHVEIIQRNGHTEVREHRTNDKES